jgi:4-aminobutyrate aminotransferase-like enzyme
VIKQLDQLIEDSGGAERLIGVYIEAIQALTGEVLSDKAWEALCHWRDRTGVPLVLSETCSGWGRSGQGRWWLDQVCGEADIVLWWAGGQIGHIFSRPTVFVSKPLTLISTWDGDELSATRLLWQLYATRSLIGQPTQTLSESLDVTLRQVFEDASLSGTGLYRVVKSPQATQIQDRLKALGVQVQTLGDRLCFAPPLTTTSDDMSRFAEALKSAVSG